MLFNSVQFLIFFPLATMLYYIFPKKYRYLSLLAASYYFYMCWNAKYALLLFFSTFVTYICGILLEKIKHKDWRAEEKIKYKKIAIGVCVIINLGVLFFFKYYNFVLFNLQRIFNHIHIELNIPEFDIILPVGISFYTFQALGYIIDVYRDDIYAEKNFFKYALFVSFFPQLVAGPIERSKNLLIQLNETKSFSWKNLREGMLIILYGLFLKMVIADRAAIIVDSVYGNSPEVYPGFYLLAATVFFAFQIYCDFYGYSLIAKGSALILDIRLMDNFNAPYLSQSVKEFWQRWHISLSSWFRDYLYIPLGGNRKGWLRKECNLLFVFGVSGLWHGASFSFIMWGLLNGLYQVWGDIRQRLMEHIPLKRRITSDTFSCRLRRKIITFSLICFSWVFFRASGMATALRHIVSIRNFNWYILFDGSLYGLGVSKEHFWLLIFFICILLYVDYKKYKKVDIISMILGQELWFQIIIYVGLLWTIILFGCYGVEYDTNQFIYFQF